MKKIILVTLACIPFGYLVAQNDEPDLNMIQKIRQEGFNHSQVMDLAFYLTEVSGPRLNNSPGFRRAANYTKNKLSEWGLTNAHLEPWGEWGKGWELKRCYVAMSAPYYKPIIAFPKSWTAGTNGLQTADIVLLSVGDAKDLELYKGRLTGKVILLPRIDSLEPAYVADASRYSEEDLKEMADWKGDNEANQSNKTDGHNIPGKGYTPSPGRHELSGAMRKGALTYSRLKQFAREEGAVAILSTNPRGRDGTLFVQGGGPWAGNAAENFPDLMLAYEDYMMLQRMAQHHIPVKLEMDVKTQFQTNDLQGYNVIAEIKGTDPKLKQELVMIGAHLDSWHASVGATDNAAGCAVMMEVVRILKTLNIQLRRTIRIALWGGEEQGLIGSKNYVRQHFMDTLTKRYNAAGDKVSVYFNLDNGTGKIRGLYLQGNMAAQPVFTKWLQPFKDLGATTITLQRTGGTDHLSFDAIGVPAFQFIQDDIEYDTRTHHSNMDSYDHLQPGDLKQAAVIIASFVYQAAQRSEKIPRK
ncbi:M20/M25/M40 family metallo-hydrolase [Niastella caeni]|uniref:Carboxypeptidase Q n=1 Tax=Niastella caeni TaxID=2569763 RepID=A0A4S8HAP2_9BACT|nr:M20/M25/M40 family metallo-hydrolase [Niastella caeni]THU30414.1 M20/M25/M40 family metallo-hydrolase [Niastella caeni]